MSTLKSPKDPLSELAAVLLNADAADKAELTRARDSLTRLASGDGDSALPASVGKLVRAAADKLSEVLAAKKPGRDAADALAAAARFVCLATSDDLHGAAWATASGGTPAASAAPAAHSNAPDVVLLPEDTDLELAGEFLTEANEHFQSAEAALLVLEERPSDGAAVDTVFRAFHTVKGVAGMMGMSAVAQLAHHAESLLARIRDGEISCTGKNANLALRSVDMLKATVAAVGELLSGHASELPPGYAELMNALIDVAHGGGAPTPSSKSRPEVSRPLPSPLSSTPEPPPPANPRPAPQAQEEGSSKWVEADTRVGSTSETSVRVRTDRLDRLIDMVGELVIAHSMLGEHQQANQQRDPELHKRVTQANKIVRELQDLSMTLRMVPLRATFQKLTRIVRDVAKKSGKSIHFSSAGDDTEIDRNMVDVIAEPLVHMVRNAADHGIEPPEVRKAAGKHETGNVFLSAYHSAGNVVIDLSDDGGGLNPERILAKAVQKGLVDSSKSLTEQEIFQLIFLPGFSTTEQVTDISGRGVGMDVVRRNIESLKGHVEINSVPGKGTSFSIRLPLTLAITDGMLVRVGSERYIIPTLNIAINFRPEASQLSSVSGRGEMILLRGEVIPLFRLHTIFGVSDAVEDPTKGLVVVLKNGPTTCGLLVDELLGQQQVVAKSLGAAVGRVEAVSGGAVLGDGRVGLILDPANLMQLAREAAPTPRRRRSPGAPVALRKAGNA
jgi:two-component system chemotaxis sensor kinase CheA